jgi:hypothetical protein
MIIDIIERGRLPSSNRSVVVNNYKHDRERAEKALIQDHISEWLGKIIVIGFGVACSMR